MGISAGIGYDEIEIKKTGSKENDIKLAAYFINQRLPFNYSPYEKD